MKEEIKRQLDVLFAKEKENMGVGHIFFRLLEQLEKTISFEEKMHLTWAFSFSEKSLREARQKNINVSRFYLDEIESNSPAENILVAHSQNFVYIPARAFYEYVCLQEFEKAIESSIEAIRSILFIVDQGFPDMLSAAIEQYLNICRVLFKMGEKKEAYEEFGSLIYFLFSGRSHTNYFSFVENNSFELMNPKDKLQMLEYVTNVVLEKLRNEDISTQHFYLNKIFAHFEHQHSDWRKGYLDLYVFVVDFLISENAKINIEDSEIIAEIVNLPNMLQYLFIKKLENTYSLKEPEFEDKFKDYCTTTLKLEHLFSDVRQGIPLSLSPIRQVVVEKEVEEEIG